MPVGESSREARLAEAKRGFAERAARHGAEIERIAAALRAGETGELDALHEFAHRLYGTAGSYGFAAASAAAGALEALIRNREPSHSIADAADKLLKELHLIREWNA